MVEKKIRYESGAKIVIPPPCHNCYDQIHDLTPSLDFQAIRAEAVVPEETHPYCNPIPVSGNLLN